MFISKVHIKNYKSINELELNFKKTESLGNLQTSVIIGENGTSKTTILEYIAKEIALLNLNNSLEIQSIDFEKNIKIIISSYSAIDKLSNLDLGNLVDNPNLQIIKTSRVLGNLSGLINRMIDLLYSKRDGELDTLKFLLKYIGYSTENLFLIPHKSKLQSIPSLIRKHIVNLEKVNKNILEFKELNSTTLAKADEMLNNYKKSLLINSNEEFNVVTEIRPYLKEVKKHKVIFFNYIYILMKYKIFLRYLEVNNHRFNLDSKDFDKYLGGQARFYLDNLILNSMGTFFWKDLEFCINEDQYISLSNLSSGQLSIFIRLFDIAYYTTDNTILLIDEPETHLHPKWIQNYLPLLNNIIGNKECHAIIATHSPLIVSDAINESIIVLKKENGKIKAEEFHKPTLGNTYSWILKEVFELDFIQGNLVENYEKKIFKYIELGKIDEAINLYLMIADEELKFKLYKYLREIM